MFKLIGEMAGHKKKPGLKRVRALGQEGYPYCSVPFSAALIMFSLAEM